MPHPQLQCVKMLREILTGSSSALDHIRSGRYGEFAVGRGVAVGTAVGAVGDALGANVGAAVVGCRDGAPVLAQQPRNAPPAVGQHRCPGTKPSARQPTCSAQSPAAGVGLAVAGVGLAVGEPDGACVNPYAGRTPWHWQWFLSIWLKHNRRELCRTGKLY